MKQKICFEATLVCRLNHQMMFCRSRIRESGLRNVRWPNLGFCVADCGFAHLSPGR